MDAAALVNPTRTLEIFGHYGGLVGVVIAALILLLLAVLVMGWRSQGKRDAFHAETMRGFANAIRESSEKSATTFSSALREQTGHFLKTVESIRSDHNLDRERMLGIIERQGEVRVTRLPQRRVANGTGG